jgi:hypothetical protein
MANFPEIFDLHKVKKKEAHSLLESSDYLLKEEPIVTGFPFTILASETNLKSMLPGKDLCDRLLVRYLECCNVLYDIIDFENYGEQYPLLWAPQPPPASLLAKTFLMIAIAARSLNPGHWLLPLISPDGHVGALRVANRWKKYGQLALSQTNLLRKSSIANIQGMLLLGLLEEGDHVRWNLLGMLGNMARVAGLFRNPSIFKELDDHAQDLRRYNLGDIAKIDDYGVIFISSLRLVCPE